MNPCGPMKHDDFPWKTVEIIANPCWDMALLKLTVEDGRRHKTLPLTHPDPSCSLSCFSRSGGRHDGPHDAFRRNLQHYHSILTVSLLSFVSQTSPFFVT